MHIMNPLLKFTYNIGKPKLYYPAPVNKMILPAVSYMISPVVSL